MHFCRTYYFYGVFMEKINKQENVDYKEINIVRYTDWAITTPIMLLVLCLAFLYNLNPDKGNPSRYIPSKFSFFTFLIIFSNELCYVSIWISRRSRFNI